MAISFADRVTISPDVMFRTVGDEAVLMNLKTELYLGLDPVGTRMWELLTKSASIEEAFDALLSEYDVEAGRLRRALASYYAAEGARRSVTIEIPLGSYVPTFYRRKNPRPIAVLSAIMMRTLRVMRAPSRMNPFRSPVRSPRQSG